MELLRYTNCRINSRLILIPISCIIILSLFPCFRPVYAVEQTGNIWEVRSIDTMKTSRDMARSKLYNSSYDAKIEKQIEAIKGMGSNYVSIDTPYDKEFLPYLKRWVRFARKIGLHVWFRGNWSNWEGWFEYPKDMTPQEHIRKTAEFIETHPNLFEDGDAFDPCPECENAGLWKQPEDDEKYRQFIRNQQVTIKQAFLKIGKDVHTNWFSIIGGRAKEVLDKETFDALGHLATIDHYVESPSSMDEYINYFYQNFHTKVLIGEFGAPIPDINGKMDEGEQAEFIDSVFRQLYKNRDNVLGVNYWVATGGTTRLINKNGTPRQAVEVIKNYFIPGAVKGTVTNTLGSRLKNINIQTSDGNGRASTSRTGSYKIVIPAGASVITIGGIKYQAYTEKFVIARGGEITRDVVLSPKSPSILYRLGLFIKKKLGI